MNSNTNITEALVQAMHEHEDACKALAAATHAYDIKRHTLRKRLYDMKESGARKMTEEQIRTETIVACSAEYEAQLQAQCKYNIITERIDTLKTIAKFNTVVNC